MYEMSLMHRQTLSDASAADDFCGVLPKCFQLYSITGIEFSYRDFSNVLNLSLRHYLSCLLQIFCMWEWDKVNDSTCHVVYNYR